MFQNQVSPKKILMENI